MTDSIPSIVSVTVQETVSVAFGSSSVTWPERLIMPEAVVLMIRIVGGTGCTTIAVSTEVVLTPSDTETWMM